MEEGESSTDWYNRIYQTEPRYDDLLEMIAPTSAERQGFWKSILYQPKRARRWDENTYTSAPFYSSIG